MNRLTYNQKLLKEDLLTRHHYENVYQIPKLEKIVVTLSLQSSGFQRKIFLSFFWPLP